MVSALKQRKSSCKTWSSCCSSLQRVSVRVSLLVRLLAAPVRGRNSPPFLVQQIFESLEQAEVASLFDEFVDPAAAEQKRSVICVGVFVR
jgi:hypothetical protein